MYSSFIFAKVNALVFLEFRNQIIDDDLVKVVTTQTVVTASSFNFEETIAQFKNGYVECSAAKVIYEDRLILRFFHTICKSGSRWFVDDTQNFKSSNFTSIFSSLTLAVIEISWNSNNSLCYSLT
ncbi:NAD-specific glutamate dehydrogenase [compost metagenome]